MMNSAPSYQPKQQNTNHNALTAQPRKKAQAASVSFRDRRSTMVGNKSVFVLEKKDGGRWPGLAASCFRRWAGLAERGWGWS